MPFFSRKNNSDRFDEIVQGDKNVMTKKEISNKKLTFEGHDNLQFIDFSNSTNCTKLIQSTTNNDNTHYSIKLDLKKENYRTSIF